MRTECTRSMISCKTYAGYPSSEKCTLFLADFSRRYATTDHLTPSLRTCAGINSLGQPYSTDLKSCSMHADHPASQYHRNWRMRINVHNIDLCIMQNLAQLYFHAAEQEKLQLLIQVACNNYVSMPFMAGWERN